jgi:hypothetical protein
MRTKPFFDVWKAIVTRHGLDPDNNDIVYPTARAIVRAINRRVRVAWRAWDWPDFSITEERAYRQVWNSQHIYQRLNSQGVPDEVFYIPTITYYQVNVNAPTDPPLGTLPTNTTYFNVLAPLDPFVSFDQICRRSIGRVIGIYKSNPRLDGFKHSGISFRVTENGIDLFQVSGPTIFVKYLPAPSKFTIIPWISTKIYNMGDIVFYFPTGECYLSIINNNTNHIPTDGTSWNWMPMPEVLAPYVEAGAYSDCMRESHPVDAAIAQGAMQQSALAEAEAKELLQSEIDVLMAMGQRHSYQQHRPPRRWVRNGLITTPVWQAGSVTTLTDICVSDGLFSPGPPPFVPPSFGPGDRQSGAFPLVIGQDFVNVVFGSALSDASWEFDADLTVVNTVDTFPNEIFVTDVTAKSTTGFTAQLNASPLTANYTLNYRATRTAAVGTFIIPPASVYLGTNARIVALDYGMAIEVRDGSGNWVRKVAWTE